MNETSRASKVSLRLPGKVTRRRRPDFMVGFAIVESEMISLVETTVCFKSSAASLVINEIVLHSSKSAWV